MERDPGKASLLYKCAFCGGEKLPQDWGNEADAMLDKALQLRLTHNYDLAHDTYLRILERTPDCIDAMWGALLSKYGVEISDRTKHRPSLHKIAKTRFTDEPLYKQFITSPRLDGVASVEYARIAKLIENVRCDALEKVRTEPKYDIFLSFKNEIPDDPNRTLTKDRATAEKLYHKLIKKGYNVFFSPVTLKNKAGLAYEPIIYAALNSARAMVLIASKQEYINSPWVANEWKRYAEIDAQSKRNFEHRNLRLFVCVSDELNERNLPEELSSYQIIDFNQKGGINQKSGEAVLLGLLEQQFAEGKTGGLTDPARPSGYSTSVSSSTPLPGTSYTVETKTTHVSGFSWVKFILLFIFIPVVGGVIYFYAATDALSRKKIFNTIGGGIVGIVIFIVVIIGMCEGC